jgi:hypothetical protein
LAESPAMTGNEGSTDFSASMVSVPSPANVGRHTKADAIAEQITESTAPIGERRLVGLPSVEPGALDAGDIALKVGDGSKQRWPDLERCIPGFAIIDRRVIAAPKAHCVLRIIGRGGNEIVGVVDGVRPGKMAGGRLAGIDDALELRVRQDAQGEKSQRQMRPV